ncbi:DUF4142 domain-containing protein [Chitinophaga sp.]|uniref:DUF4142 domain-containing protein n=1 Tax=Chitinophaga sp. TaxID=1869181 RepID=UPI0031D78170
MKTLHFLLLCCAYGTVTLTSCDNNDDDTNVNLSARDRTFITKAGFNNKAEIVAGAVADSMGTDSTVRMYGKMMVDDHTTAYQELADYANSWSVSIPQQPDSIHIAKTAYLRTLSGHMFDTAYINAQVKDHIETIALFQTEADSSQMTQLKSYAAKYLPKLKMHLQMADSIAAVLHAK